MIMMHTSTPHTHLRPVGSTALYGYGLYSTLYGMARHVPRTNGMRAREYTNYKADSRLGYLIVCASAALCSQTETPSPTAKA